MKVFAAAELLAGQPLDGLFHGIHRIAAAGEHRQFQQAVPCLRKWILAVPAFSGRPGEQPLHRHAVFGEGAGLVDGEHGGAAQALHRSRPAGQHPDPAEPQGPEGQKKGDHHGDLVGQHRQGQGQPCQQGLHGPPLTLSACRNLHQGEGGAEAERPAGDAAREPPRLALQGGGRSFHRGQAAAQSAQFGAAGHCLNGRQAAAAGHQGAGQDPSAGLLPLHRQGFAGDQGFIQPQSHPLEQAAIGGDPVALLQPQQVARPHLIGGKIEVHTVAAQPGPWGREAGQFRQGPVAAVLLHRIQQGDRRHEQQQHGRVGGLPQQAVEHGAGQQEQVGGFQDRHGAMLGACHQRGSPRRPVVLIGSTAPQRNRHMSFNVSS